MEDKEKLQNDANIGQALKELRNQSGWKYLVELLQAEYTENVKTLIDKDDVTARATIKAIDKLLDGMDLAIKMSDVATEELKSERFKETQATP